MSNNDGVQIAISPDEHTSQQTAASGDQVPAMSEGKDTPRKPRRSVDAAAFWASCDARTASGMAYQTKRGRPRQGVPSLAGTLAAEFDISVQTARRLLRRGRPFQVRHVQDEAVA